MALRGIRGATLLSADDMAEMKQAVEELLSAMMVRNGVALDDLISIILTATPDLHCAFPASAARDLGMVDVPLLCAVEMDVSGAVERAVRVLMHVESSRPRSEIEFVYLRGAEILRLDLQK